LPIDQVDRPKIGHANFLGAMKVNKGFYKVGIKNGALAQLYTRN
jgi:hypothetical protein